MKKIALVTLSLFVFILFQRFKNSTPSETAKDVPSQLELKQAREDKKPKVPKKVNITVKPKKLSSQTSPKIIPPASSAVKNQEKLNQQGKKIVMKDGFVPMTAKGEIVITSIALDGEKAITQGDILIGYKDDVMDINRQQKPIVIPRPRLWEKGIVHYEIETNLPNRNEVLKSIEYFNQLGIVKFVEGYADNYLYFRAGDNNCYSYVGVIGGEQEVSLAVGCRFKQINHEIMHALGFFHEQSREDRDDYIKINWDNISSEYHPQFLKITESFTGLKNSTFDFNSLMLYSPYAFSMTPGAPSMEEKAGGIYKVNQNGELSDEDIKRLKQLYQEEIAKREN